jgi:hypothetical protein
LVTDTSARAMTAVVSVSLSLAATGSVVALVAIAAVFDKFVPSGTELATLTTIVQVTEAPATRPALVQVTVPAALAQPALAESKLVPAGSASVTVNPALLDGPRLETSIV